MCYSGIFYTPERLQIDIISICPGKYFFFHRYPETSYCHSSVFLVLEFFRIVVGKLWFALYSLVHRLQET